MTRFFVTIVRGLRHAIACHDGVECDKLFSANIIRFNCMEIELFGSG